MRVKSKTITYSAGVVAVFVGWMLIRAELARTAAGDPPAGNWGLMGVIMIGFVAFCIANSVRRPRRHRKGCCR